MNIKQKIALYYLKGLYTIKHLEVFLQKGILSNEDYKLIIQGG